MLVTIIKATGFFFRLLNRLYLSTSCLFLSTFCLLISPYLYWSYHSNCYCHVLSYYRTFDHTLHLGCSFSCCLANSYLFLNSIRAWTLSVPFCFALFFLPFYTQCLILHLGFGRHSLMFAAWMSTSLSLSSHFIQLFLCTLIHILAIAFFLSTHWFTQF